MGQGLKRGRRKAFGMLQCSSSGLVSIQRMGSVWKYSFSCSYTTRAVSCAFGIHWSIEIEGPTPGEAAQLTECLPSTCGGGALISSALETEDGVTASQPQHPGRRGRAIISSRLPLGYSVSSRPAWEIQDKLLTKAKQSKQTNKQMNKS